MNKKPAHLSGTAGQTVNEPIIGDTEEMFLARKGVQTLGDYITSAQRSEAIARAQASEKEKKKMTFEQWCNHRFPAGCQNDTKQFMELAWKAAQENI